LNSYSCFLSPPLSTLSQYGLHHIAASIPCFSVFHISPDLSVSPAPSNASSASFRPNPGHAQPVTYSLHQKKKKIRVVDSDEEGHSKRRWLPCTYNGGADECFGQVRDRSMTLASPPPPAVHTSSTSGLKLKLAPSHTKARPHLQPDPSPTPSASTPTASALLGAGIDFSLPHALARPLVPPRPGVQKPLKPGPKRQADVEEDFSSVKVPSQIAFTTFWSSVEPYLREIREDDLALLNFKVHCHFPFRSNHRVIPTAAKYSPNRPTLRSHTRYPLGVDIIPKFGTKKTATRLVPPRISPFPAPDIP